MINEELEMLQSILMGDISNTSNKEGHTICIKLQNDHHLNVSVTISVPLTYPAVTPVFAIDHCPMLKPNELHAAIKQAQNAYIPDTLSLFQMYNAIKEDINDKLNQAVKLDEEIKRKQYMSSVAYQEAKVVGITNVTAQSYNEWRKKFDGEQEIEKADVGMSGKQIFLSKKEKIDKEAEDRDEDEIDFDKEEKKLTKEEDKPSEESKEEKKTE